MSDAYGQCEMAAAESILCRETEAISYCEGTAGLKEVEEMYRKKSLEAAAAISKTFEKQQMQSKVAFKRMEKKKVEMASMVKMMSKLGGFQF